MSDDSTTDLINPILPIPVEMQEEVCRLIASGEFTEDEAVARACTPQSHFEFWKGLDQGLADRLDAAYKKRAAHWHDKIMKGVDDIPDKEYAAGAKLQFEKLKYLAEIDDPDRFGKKSTATIDIKHSVVHTIKKMTTKEALQILSDDPFSSPVEAEFKEMVEEDPIKGIPPKPKEYSL